MDKEQFLNEMQDVLQRDDAVNENDNLSDYEEWDSLSKMAVMAFFDKRLGKKISLKELGEIQTVSDLLKIAGL